ncbi:MAG: T9SS type A sorting domain-containing protein [Saprospiraceae bacterium]
MAKTMTFRNLIAVFLLLTSTLSVSAQFWTETFDNQAAFNAWTAASTGQGTQVWNWSTNTGDPMGFGPTAPTPFASPTSDGGFAFYNSDANGDGNTHVVTLTYGPIDCASHTDVGLRFHSQFADFQGSTAQVRVSTNGGNTWTAYDVFDNQPSYGVGQGALVPADILTEMAIPAADGQAQVWLQFRWEGFWEYGWKLDDIELFDFVAAISDVTFQVNASQIAVNPAGMYIAGSFTGLMPVAMTDLGGGVWSYTAPLAEGDYLYRFLNGPTGFENGLTLGACGAANPTLGGFDRTLTVGTEDIILPAVCFNSCNPCVVPCPLNPNKIVCDNMESYATTQKLAQQNIAQQGGAANAWWTTWSGTAGTTEDGIISTEQANSGTKSFKILTTAPAGGPQDVVLKLGNRTTGRYELKWMYYVPVGKQAYYNIQNVVPIGAGAWNLDAFFGINNTGNIQIGAGASLATFTYPNGEWFEVRHIIDLDNNLLTLWVDGQYVHKMSYPNNLGGIDFYGINNNHTNYIDDIEYISLPPLVYNVDVCDAAVDLTLFFGQPITQTTGIYDNTNATVSPTDPGVDCWNEDPGADILDGTMWYTFVGDGEKYHIETVPCNATNYIGTAQQDPGDTQMLIYAGDDCDDLTEVACNDDLYPTGDPDWRSGVDLVTDPGQNYFMLIDGFNFGGTIALGEYCIEITKVASVLCADGAVGTYTTSSELLCWNDVLSDLITVDPSGFVLPNEGIVAGMAWAISAGPLDPAMYPADDPNYLGSFQVLPDVYSPGVPNNNSSFMMAGNIYYFTPVVIGNGNNGGLPNFLHNIDITGGCYYVGESVGVAFLPETTPITATIVAGAGSANLTPGGGIGALIGDDSYYSYIWSNGATTQDLANVPVGTYTVTVTDECSTSATKSVTITVSDTKDPASIQSFVISPNPTAGILTLNLALATSADVRIEVLNTLGQTLQSINVGKLSNLSQNVDLSNMAQGSYFLRVTVDGETAIRRVLVQR